MTKHIDKYTVVNIDGLWFVLELGGMCALRIGGPFSSKEHAEKFKKETH